MFTGRGKWREFSLKLLGAFFIYPRCVLISVRVIALRRWRDLGVPTKGTCGRRSASSGLLRPIGPPAGQERGQRLPSRARRRRADSYGDARASGPAFPGMGRRDLRQHLLIWSCYAST